MTIKMLKNLTYRTVEAVESLIYIQSVLENDISERKDARLTIGILGSQSRD